MAFEEVRESKILPTIEFCYIRAISASPMNDSKNLKMSIKVPEVKYRHAAESHKNDGFVHFNSQMKIYSL